ncbi:MAG: CHAD domain-containing protein [Bacteroidetes bacterium]|nr:CHAD domain-containing protein [Bacteroidota bacterium]
MPVNTISEHWVSLQKKFEILLAQLKQQNSKEGVHDIRVLIKHFNAYNRLYENILHKKRKNDKLTDTKIFFSSLGRQRDLEMSLELLSAFENKTGKSYLAFKDFISASLITASQNSNKTVSSFDHSEIIKTGEEIKLRLSYISEDEMIHITKKECKKTISKTNLLAKKFTKNAHAIRKQLKRLGYWLKLLPEQSLLSKRETNSLNSLLDELGKWQDNRMLIKEMDSFLQNTNLLSKQKDLYKNLKKRIEGTNTRLLKIAEVKFLQTKKAALAAL